MHTKSKPFYGRPCLSCMLFSVSICELFFPLQSPGSPRPEIPEKWGNITKFPSPVQPPKMGKNYRKITKNVLSEYFCNFSVIFPHFRGLDGEGNFVMFPHFSGISAPGASGGSVRGKTTRNSQYLRPVAAASLGGLASVLTHNLCRH